jgi:hypothetical protein
LFGWSKLLLAALRAPSTRVRSFGVLLYLAVTLRAPAEFEAEKAMGRAAARRLNSGKTRDDCV